MSYSADFIFNIPSQFKEPADLAKWLNDELGLSIKGGRDGESWDGPHLGLFLHFAPRHGMEAQPGLPYDGYQSSIGLTGYAGQSDLRVSSSTCPSRPARVHRGTHAVGLAQAVY